ncbi:RNA-binding protein [Streptomyces sp. NPDC057939]|uniref:RNA-binding protein n=1 Tax=Streptomyces sp. NPDC057939 TaxID=3346284 RepID=UPI0036E49CF3
MPTAFVHRITKYDPADRDEHGHYVGVEGTESDHGPVEAAYLEAIAAFAKACDVDRLEIREPGVAGAVHFGGEPLVAGHGLGGLFPPDLTGFHDGAKVSLPVALELVRIMLRGQGAWCGLEAENRFAVHVGWDLYVHVGSDGPCPDAVARTRALGLFPEPVTASPHTADLEEREVTAAADADFWTRLRTMSASAPAVLLEENHVRNATRWYRLTEANLDAVRAGLTPRALLTVWPDLNPDVDAVLAALPEDGSVEFVWETQDGKITHVSADSSDHEELAFLVADAKAACALSPYVDERHPLACAALPDSDGVLRARW